MAVNASECQDMHINPDLEYLHRIPVLVEECVCINSVFLTRI